MCMAPKEDDLLGCKEEEEAEKREEGTKLDAAVAKRFRSLVN